MSLRLKVRPSFAHPPYQTRCSSALSPTLHRLCTDFGTEEERRKNEGKTNVGLRDLHLKNQRLSRDIFFIITKKCVISLQISNILCKFAQKYVFDLQNLNNEDKIQEDWSDGCVAHVCFHGMYGRKEKSCYAKEY